VVTISFDTSGESLHKRGHKEAVGAKAPIARESGLFDAASAPGVHRPPRLWSTDGALTDVRDRGREMRHGPEPRRSRHFAFERPRDALIPIKGALCVTIPPRRRRCGLCVPTANAGAVRMQRDERGDGQGYQRQCSSKTMPAGADPPDGPPGLVRLTRPYGAAIA